MTHQEQELEQQELKEAKAEERYQRCAYADVCDRAMAVMHECEVTYGVLRCEECELWEERQC